MKDWTYYLIEPIAPLDISFVPVSILKKPFVMSFLSAWIFIMGVTNPPPFPLR